MSDNEAYESADEEINGKLTVKLQEYRINLINYNFLVPTQPSATTTKAKEPEVESTASSWRSWGAFTALSSVSKNFASVTAQVVDNVSQSLSMVSIPDPEEMAKLHKEEETKHREKPVVEKSDEDESISNNSVFQMISNVSKMSSKVVTDTLEEIGKKTINIIHETDPNIKNKIKSIGNNRNESSNLSELLKEAKEKNEELVQNDSVELSKLFDNLLDEFKGLMHLEALEVLSKQSKLKIEVLVAPLAGKALCEMEETLNEVEELCEMPDCETTDESFDVSRLQEKLLKAIEDLNVTMSFNEIVDYTTTANEMIESLENCDATDLFKKAIETLAKLCALSLTIYCKLAEKLLLLNQHRSTADEVDSISQ